MIIPNNNPNLYEVRIACNYEGTTAYAFPLIGWKVSKRYAFCTCPISSLDDGSLFTTATEGCPTKIIYVDLKLMQAWGDDELPGKIVDVIKRSVPKESYGYAVEAVGNLLHLNLNQG